MVFTGEFGGESSVKIESQREKEKKLVMQYITGLDNVNDFVINNESFRDQDFSVCFSKILGLEGDVRQITNALGFVKFKKELLSQFDHDTKGIGARVKGALDSLIDLVSNGITENRGVDFFYKSFEAFQNSWDRFYVSFKDILLKFLSEKTVPLEMQEQEFDMGTLRRVLSFFEKTEVPDLIKTSHNLERLKNTNSEIYERVTNGKGNPYEGIENRKITMDIDWDGLSEQLVGKKIKGDTAVVASSLVSILSNPLKKRIEVEGEHTELKVKIFIKGNEVVFRIEDTGKGIEDKHLDPTNKDFMFLPGNSGTGSTGLGLFNVHTRLASMGIELRVFSRRVNEIVGGKENMDSKPYVYYSNGGGEKDYHMSFYHGKDAKGLVSSNISNHGTLFEIYLSLE